MTDKAHINSKNNFNPRRFRLFHWLSVSIAFFLICGMGCKRTDRSDPKLSITEPTDELFFRAGTDILIQGRASDKQGLASLTFSLTDATGIIYQSQENELSGAEMDFSFVFLRVGDLQTESGAYSIKVTARDVNGNFVSEFLPVQIEAIPQKLYKTLLGVEDAQQSYSLYLYDTLKNTTPGISLGNSVSIFQMDNHQQEFLTATRFSGILQSFRPDDFTIIWSDVFPTGSGQATFTDLYRTQTDYYVGLGLSPFSRIYGPDGSLYTTWNTLIYPVNAIYFQQDRIFTGESSFNGQVKRLAAYALQTQDLVLVRNLGWDIMDILPLNEVELLVIGNGGTAGHIYVINRSTFAITEDYDLATPVTNATLGPTRAYIATQGGVRALDRESYTLTTIYAGDFSSIGYEPTQNQLFLGKANGVEIISTGGTLVEEITGIPGTVQYIDFHLNK